MNEIKLIVSTQAAALELLYYLRMRLATQKTVSVADYRALVGLSEIRNDMKFGWKTLDGVEPIKVRDGWTLSLPKPEPL